MEQEKLTPYENYSSQIEDEMYKFEAYLREVNDSLDKKHLDEHTAIFLTGRRDLFDEVFAKSRLESFKALFHQSTFLTCYAVFENLFKQLCNLVQVQEKCRFSILDMGGNDTIKNCRTYIEKAANVHLTDGKVTWEEIMFYKHLRNTLTHHNALEITEKTERNLIKFLKNRKGIVLDGKAFRIVNDSFVLEFVHSFSIFLSNIAYAVDLGKTK